VNEDQLIEWLRRAASLIGDDAAIVPEDERWAITMDSQIAGVHFPPDLDPAVIARRAVAVNLSDLAAMGASPAYAFVALAAPAGFDHRRFLAALLGACRKYGLELAGGDLARAREITVVLTVLGRRGGGRRWLLRRAARAGEHLWLGGTVGESAAGCRLVARGARIEGRKVLLPAGFESPSAVAAAARRAIRRHLSPQPQLELGIWLARREAGAAIDVSDGLARDLHRMCKASGVGAEIELRRLPLGRNFERLARRLSCGWWRLALGGGEDYVLLFTLPPGVEPPIHYRCTRIGRIRTARDRREPRVFLLRDGEREPLPALGWDHLETPETS
jgi:thiamine-monophosphate kinase